MYCTYMRAVQQQHLMSALWAIEAARNSRTSDATPGLSRHIAREMRANLEEAKDGLLLVDVHLLACALGLNDIIDSINAGAPVHVLLEQTELLSVPDLPPVEDTTRSYTTLLRSDGDIEVPRMELKLEHSERVVSQKPTPQPDSSLQQPDARAETTADARSEVRSVAESRAETRVETLEARSETERTETRSEPETRSETLEAGRETKLAEQASDREVGNDAEHTAQVKTERLLFRETEPPVSSPEKSPAAQKTDDIAISRLSPVTILRTALPTSPNVDLSFIPIANTINPNKFDQNDSNDESDNSFQAISTAIRKSFAGKLSMGRFSTAAPLFDDDDARKSNGEAIRSTRSEIETNSSRQTLAGQRLRPRSIYNSKRSSLFVSLPSREPISYLTSKNTIVKTEEVEKTTSKIPRKPVQRIAQKEAQTSVRGPKLEHSLLTSLKPQSTSLGRSDLVQKKSTFGARSVPNRSRSRSPVRSRSPIARERATAKSSFGASLSRTTTAGSPVREEVLSSRIPALSPQRSRGRSPVKIEGFSSKDSSRSPTKYSHRTDGSTKGSPSNFPDFDVISEKQDLNFLLRLTLPTSASAAKRSKTPVSKDPIMRNKFLSTTLNPEKPPPFNPKRTKSRSPLRRSETASKRDTLRQIDDIKLESKTEVPRPKQKITINLNHKSDLRATNGANSDASSHKLARSPKKITKPTNGKLISLRTSTKRGPEPMDTNVAPRKRAGGNAVPLPEAARGIFVREKSKAISSRELTTPSRPTMRAPRGHEVGSSVSPGMAPDELPDIPSDDEALKNTKYMKSWAETPELLRVMREKRDIDPISIFGEVPALKIDEVFDTAASRQRGQMSP